MKPNDGLVPHLVGNVPGILQYISNEFGGVPKYRVLNSDLLVFLAEVNSGPFFTEESLGAQGLIFEEAYPIALNNLERHFQNGDLRVTYDGIFGHIETDGFFPSYLILLDRFWDSLSLGTHGELVVGIPTRGELLFSDTAKNALIPMLIQETGIRYEKGPHRLSSRLFVRRGRNFEPYTWGVAPRKWWQFWK